MIVDLLQNWEQYSFGPAGRRAFEFLLDLKPDAEEKKFEIIGEDVFARIMSYETLPPEKTGLETHRIYADIQLLLAGTERIEWHPKALLEVKTPYNPEKDIEFHHCGKPAPAHTDLSPGLFVLYLPQDAHRPQLAINGPERVKKVVIKIKADLVMA
ncbi:MAG: YhcH/YjgK/YiaL family protein [Candidatus Omnitrophota bacterium]